MNSDIRHTYVVEPETLAKIQAILDQLVQTSPVCAGALIAANGAVLASAGRFPLPEDQMGATAAGVFSALHALMPDDHQMFSARSCGDSWELHFVKLDTQTFLLIANLEGGANRVLSRVMEEVVGKARHVLIEHEGGKKLSQRALSQLEEKLDELFSSCKKNPSKNSTR